MSLDVCLRSYQLWTRFPLTFDASLIVWLLLLLLLICYLFITPRK